jgi:hypothetical protein
MNNTSLKNYQRTYCGNLKVNFYEALDSINDVEYKNYSNFYLSRDAELQDIFETENKDLISGSVYTTLDFSYSYLSFNVDSLSSIDNDDYLMTDVVAYPILNNIDFSENQKFTIDFGENNTCQIYHNYDNRKYYLTVTSGLNIFFVSESPNSTPTTFKYIYSSDDLSLYLIVKISGITYTISKVGNSIKAVELKINQKMGLLSSPVKITKNLYTKSNKNNITNFVKYYSNNDIDKEKIERNLTNNFLLHRTDDVVDIIMLKNQLLQNDVFSSSNNLLSSGEINFFVDGLREYTSIFNDIDQENDEDLTLNYVFYNKYYTIKEGLNTIITPTNMEPFEQININDTKFTNSGSFPFPVPKYADKVYYNESETNKNENGQYFLCTWLSGSPLSEDSGVWVDRYYYPDLISKEAALLGDNSFNITYNNQIEQLIASNVLLEESTIKNNFFDKKSDMVFSPNEKYTYSRISKIITESTPLKICGVENVNYFRSINESGKFTLSFYFQGDDTTWIFKSKRNKIDGGLKIAKIGGMLNFELKLYDNSLVNTTIIKFIAFYKELKKNFVTVSVDTLKGVCYFFLNSDLVGTFHFPEKQFYQKNILFGDFTINDVLLSTTPDYIERFRLSLDYSIPELAFIQPILDGVDEIDTIYLTLPCGMRNSFDNIELLQTVCSNNAFKSNHIDVYIKNTDLEEKEQEEIVKFIDNNKDKFLPINTEINNITFKTYK